MLVVFYSMLHAWFNAWAEMFRFAVSQIQLPLTFRYFLFFFYEFSLHFFFFHSRIGCFTGTGGIARHLPAITARGTSSSTTGSTPTCTVMSAQYVNEQKFRKIPSKEYKVVQKFLRRRSVCENSQSLWHTHETQGPSTSIVPSHMPQLFTAFPWRLRSVNPQKFDFRKSHFWREFEVVHYFWNEKVWQSEVRYAISQFFSFFSKIWLRLIDGENYLDCFFG